MQLSGSQPVNAMGCGRNAAAEADAMAGALGAVAATGSAGFGGLLAALGALLAVDGAPPASERRAPTEEEPAANGIAAGERLAALPGLLAPDSTAAISPKESPEEAARAAARSLAGAPSAVVGPAQPGQAVDASQTGAGPTQPGQAVDASQTDAGPAQPGRAIGMSARAPLVLASTIGVPPAVALAPARPGGGNDSAAPMAQAVLGTKPAPGGWLASGAALLVPSGTGPQSPPAAVENLARSAQPPLAWPVVVAAADAEQTPVAIGAAAGEVATAATATPPGAEGRLAGAAATPPVAPAGLCAAEAQVAVAAAGTEAGYLGLGKLAALRSGALAAGTAVSQAVVSGRPSLAPLLATASPGAPVEGGAAPLAPGIGDGSAAPGQLAPGSAAVGSSGPVVPVDVRRQVATQLLRQENSLARNGAVTLRLDPPQLGRVEVVLTRQGEQLVVTFRAETLDVERSLRGGVADLHSALAARGGRWSDVAIRFADSGDRDAPAEDQGDERYGGDRGHDGEQAPGQGRQRWDADEAFA